MPNSLLTSIINQVYTETGRPDLVSDTLQAVLEATQTAHLLDNLPRDITESQVVFDTAAYIQNLDSTAIPYYRSLCYARKWDPSFTAASQNPYLDPPFYSYTQGLGGTGGFPYPNYPNQAIADLEIIEASDYRDLYWGTERFDVAYQAGTQINIKSSTPLKYLRLGWYKFPQLNVDLYDSWIASLFPAVIYGKASATIFSNTGDTDSYSMLMNPNTGKWRNNRKDGSADLMLQTCLSALGR